ncbi:MAG: hypothetical protein GXX96_31020 [Planctomycetaceae bacterium]|nr:hypothetical protein [Planctomycetaceae bacterium]
MPLRGVARLMLHVGEGVFGNQLSPLHRREELPGELQPLRYRRIGQLLVGNQVEAEGFGVGHRDFSHIPIGPQEVGKVSLHVSPDHLGSRLRVDPAFDVLLQEAGKRCAFPLGNQPRLTQLVGQVVPNFGSPPGRFGIEGPAACSRRCQVFHLRLDCFGHPLGDFPKPDASPLAVRPDKLDCPPAVRFP